MVVDRIPRAASPSLPKNFPSLDPEAVARAAEAQRQAIAAQSPNYQQMLYQQSLDAQRAQLAQNIARSRAEAGIATSYTPNPRSAASPVTTVPSSAPFSPAVAVPVATRLLGGFNAASTAVSLQGVSDQVEGFFLERATYLPPALRDFLRSSPDNNPFAPGNYLRYASDQLSRRLFDRLFPNHTRSNDVLTAAQPLPVTPPFYGGQQAGRAYSVSAQVTYSVSDAQGNPTPRTDTYQWELTGPISGFSLSRTGVSPSQFDVLHIVAGGVSSFVGSFGVNPETGTSTLQSYNITNITPVDGQPDTAGNPPPAPGATRPEGQRSPSIAPSRNIAPVITPQRPIPNNPNPAGQARSNDAPTPAIVPTAAKPSSPLHPKNLSPGKAINPFKSVPDPAPNPVAPAGQAALQPTVTRSTSPAPLVEPNTPTTVSTQRPNETTQDYIERLHNEELQRFRDSANLGFTNPFENLTSNILEQNPTTATATPSLNPLIPALGVAGLVGAGVVIARRTIPSGLESVNPTQTGNPSAPVTARPTRTQTQTTPQTPEFPGTGTGTPTNFCSYDSRNISGKVDQTNATLNSIQVVLQQQVLNTVNSIDNKMGNTALTGGVTGALNTIGNTVQTIQNFSKKTWDFLQIDRILSFLTFVTVLHNAYMLSNAVTQTLFSAISTALDATGLDEILGLVKSDDEEVNVGEIVGKLTDNFFKSIFGVETVDGLKKEWKKYNRIYQAATNMLYSIQSMVFSMVEILETISDYTGRIGNALKKSGVVLQNAFNWMNPNANYQNGKFFRYLNNIQEFLEVVEEMSSEVVSIQDTAREFYDQKQEFDKAIEEAEKKVSDDENKNKVDSTRPLMNITRQDEQKVEGT